MIANLAEGTIAAGSKGAVNGGRLYAQQQQFGDMAERVTVLEMSSTSGSMPSAPSPGMGPRSAST